MPSAPNVLMIALDACDYRLMLHLAAEGRAPAIDALLGRAAQAGTSAPFGVYEGAIWPSLFTARSAEKHGFYCHEELDVGTYDHRATSPQELAGTPFWDVLGRAGKRVAVIDVPHSVVSGPVNGIQVTEWGCHDRHAGFDTWPRSLAKDIEQQFGFHPVGGIDAGSDRPFAPCDVAHRAGGSRRTPAEAHALFSDLLAGVDAKTALSLHLLDQEDWDLFVTVLGEGHCTGHQFWFLHDPNDAAHDPKLAAEMGDPVVQMYARLDQALGAHLERASADTTVFVLLSHGMGPMNSGIFLIDAVLRRLAEAEALGIRGRRPARALKRVWHGLPVRLRRKLAPVMARAVRRRLRASHDGLSRYQDLFDRCPGCSAASALVDGQPWFVTPNNTVCAGIRINLVGREPHGVVEPGAGFDEVFEQLAADLLDIVKVETGQPLVRGVTRASDHFDLADTEKFPDVFVEWDRRSPTKTVYSPKVGVVHEPYDHSRTGDHFPDGLLLATGPGIVPCAVLPSIPVEDIAPTICAHLGVELPDVDGRPIPELTSTRPADGLATGSSPRSKR
jgi:predicted AlkP superfamily phosphohydrolase/phosphomutase